MLSACRTSFAALATKLRAEGKEAKQPLDCEWSVQRNWAMRFLGVPPPIVAFAELGLLGPMPVRCGVGFKSAKDRTFAR